MFITLLTIARETKRTVRYENDSEGTAITVLYIQKSALPTPYPERIKVSVEKI